MDRMPGFSVTLISRMMDWRVHARSASDTPDGTHCVERAGGSIAGWKKGPAAVGVLRCRYLRRQQQLGKRTVSQTPATSRHCHRAAGPTRHPASDLALAVQSQDQAVRDDQAAVLPVRRQAHRRQTGAVQTTSVIASVLLARPAVCPTRPPPPPRRSKGQAASLGQLAQQGHDNNIDRNGCNTCLADARMPPRASAPGTRQKASHIDASDA